MSPFTRFLLQLRNRHFLAADLVVFSLASALALALRTDGFGSLPEYGLSLLTLTLLFLPLKLAIFYMGGMYRRFWRYASVDELAHIARLGLLLICAQTAAFFLLLRPLGFVAPEFPRSVPVIGGLLAVLIAGGLRYSVRLAERSLHNRSGKGEGQRVLVAGAGAAGVMIVQEMQRNRTLDMVPVAFVDDAPEKQGVRIRGVPVVGRLSDIRKAARETGADQVIIAMPSATGKIIRDIVHICEQAGVSAKTIPGMSELLGGTVSVSQVRDIDIEDLLRREPVRTDTAAVAKLLRGKRVLITGGGGSIGSELCHQVLPFEPQSLVILGHGENSVFEIHGALTRLLHHGLPVLATGERNKNVGTQIHSVIADIRFADRVRAVFKEYKPDVVFHAAAHKHVHLMEMNPAEAITNNVVGTRNLLEASLATGVENFVMISSDKAVNPTGIMGASKRAAELLVHQAARESGRPYVAVRFGNVLGSRGSVVLTFKQQIAAGGPVTVTHPDMVRYFMTIPEAVQLVLQAVPLGSGGEVFMLDMGEPVKIVDLARDLIELSGLRLGHDIDIEFTGMRPGEKLYEEMFLPGEKYERTQHEKVFIAANASSFVLPGLAEAVCALEEAARRNDKAAIVAGLRSLVPGFQPVGHTREGNGRHHEPVTVPAPSWIPSVQGANISMANE